MVKITNLSHEKVDALFLKRIAYNILEREQQKNADLSIVLVDAQKAKQLHRMYRGKDSIPNVLSFEEPELGLGEIVLCPVRIRKDAKKYGITYKEELGRMLIHGVLHLLGYDHEAGRIKEHEMTKKEMYYYNETP
ncbi:MAG: rRNA maturation RNase YbeY [Candidatus Wildermuthbacteria bacterium]|nr:rRNA maturation RNase YbeY [Candidatus Wildermuthbacteria bacterium]